jgi:hypothetical protein
VVFASNRGIARLEVGQLPLLEYAASVSTHEHACEVFASKAHCSHEWHSMLWRGHNVAAVFKGSASSKSHRQNRGARFVEAQANTTARSPILMAASSSCLRSLSPLFVVRVHEEVEATCPWAISCRDERSELLFVAPDAVFQQLKAESRCGKLGHARRPDDHGQAQLTQGPLAHAGAFPAHELYTSHGRVHR